MYKIKFMDDKPMTVSLGLSGRVPSNSTTIVHPDGTKLYLVPQISEKSAGELIVLQSKFDKSKKTVKYLQYGYIEHVIDTTDPDMFLLIMNDFGEWHKNLFF